MGQAGTVAAIRQINVGEGIEIDKALCAHPEGDESAQANGVGSASPLAFRLDVPARRHDILERKTNDAQLGSWARGGLAIGICPGYGLQGYGNFQYIDKIYTSKSDLLQDFLLRRTCIYARFSFFWGSPRTLLSSFGQELCSGSWKL